MRTAAGDAAELRRWKFIVVLELEPVNEAVPIALIVHFLKQFGAIQSAKLARAKAIPEYLYVLLQLPLGKQFLFISGKGIGFF